LSAAQPLLDQTLPVQFEGSLIEVGRDAPIVQREKSTFLIPR
jgi:hypothetical protein